jgi:hypothetical protein
MMERELDPNEVARLLALPESHPERVRAMRDPELASLALTLEAFESAPAGTDAGALESVRAALRERLAAASVPRGGPRPRTFVGTASERQSRFFGWFSTPASRMAVAFAGVLVVAGISWWGLDRDSRREIVRGGENSSTFRMLEPRNTGDQLALSWTPVRNAERYHVRFLGPDLGVIADTDAGSSTTIVLRRGALPGGLALGARLAVEVVAMRGGAELATTEARPIRLP